MAVGSGAMIPASVMKDVTSAAGVTSKAGFFAAVPDGATRTCVNAPCAVNPYTYHTSSSPRSSMGIAAPSGVSRSKVERGAAT